MKRILIPVALLLFSAGVYLLFVLPNQIEQKFNDAIPENVEVNYKDFQVNLLDKSVVVETLKLEDNKVRVEMGRTEVKTEEYSGEMIQVQLNDVTLTDKENEEIYKAQQVTIQEIDRKQLEETSKNSTLRDLFDALKRDAIRQVEMNEVSVTRNGQTTTVDSVKVETLGEGKVFGIQAEGIRSKDSGSEIAIASVNVDEVEVDSEDQLTLNHLKLGGVQVKEGEGDLTIEDVSIDQVRNQQANNFSMKQLNLQNFENIEKLSIESAEARNIPLVTLLESEIDLLQRLLGGTFEGLQLRNLFVQPDNEFINPMQN